MNYKNRIHLKSIYLKLLLAFGFFILTNCSTDDSRERISVSYAFDTYETVFWSIGQTTAPEVNWQGEVGTFLLKDPVEGLAIDNSTGIISWDKSLGIGSHPISVIAMNPRGSAEVALTIESTLAPSSWRGGQNNNPEESNMILIAANRQLEFFEDGSLQIEILGQEGSEGVGVWSIEDDSIEIHLCTYCPNENPFDIPQSDEHTFYTGKIRTFGTDGASISGKWYIIRFNPDSTTLRGQFVFSVGD